MHNADLSSQPGARTALLVLLAGTCWLGLLFFLAPALEALQFLTRGPSEAKVAHFSDPNTTPGGWVRLKGGFLPLETVSLYQEWRRRDEVMADKAHRWDFRLFVGADDPALQKWPEINRRWQALKKQNPKPKDFLRKVGVAGITNQLVEDLAAIRPKHVLTVRVDAGERDGSERILSVALPLLREHAQESAKAAKVDFTMAFEEIDAAMQDLSPGQTIVGRVDALPKGVKEEFEVVQPTSTACILRDEGADWVSMLIALGALIGALCLTPASIHSYRLDRQQTTST